ncbi:MAG: hypothetical protein K8D98_00235 [Rhodanobacter sp.]|nr:hypothetical protein [Rhodanobacter sp.]
MIIEVMPGRPLEIREACLYVLPSTQDTLTAARKAGTVPLIGNPSLVPEAVTPSAFLKLCEQAEAAGGIAPGAIAFTDQIVEPHHAPFLVEQDGKRTYLPAIEVLACWRFSMDLHVWMGEDWEHLDATKVNQDRSRALRATANHLRQCDTLGDAWLARGWQWQRTPESRVANGLHRIRYYESYLMQTAEPGGLTEEARDALRALGVRRKAFQEARRAAA